MKAKSLSALLILALLLALCAGCTIHINPSAGITTNDSFHYSTYDNAADYTAGRFTYQAEDIRAVRVYWVAGSIDLIEKNSAELSVSDSADNRSQEAQLHSLLRDGILTIHYCASDYRGEMQSEWKQLTIEIPSGIELTIENVSAPIQAAALTTPQLHIATVSGDISIDSLVGENAEFDTVSGNIEVDTANVKTVSLNSVSGNFDWERLTVDQLTADTVSGDLDFEFISCREAALNTISGETDLTLPAQGGTVRFDTASGAFITQRAYQKQDHFYGFGRRNAKSASPPPAATWKSNNHCRN